MIKNCNYLSNKKKIQLSNYKLKTSNSVVLPFTPYF